MQFNITWDASVGRAPAAFKSVVLDVANFFAANFTDNTTVNLDVGYGEVGGTHLSRSALGASQTYLTTTSYDQIKQSLAADQSTTADQSAVASLSATDPLHAGQYWLTTANAKALGLTSGSSVDGYIGFSSSAKFDFNRADGISAGSYDFYAVVAHEISEVMGRQLLAGSTLGGVAKSFEALDLFHYAAPATWDLSGSTPGYLSVDGGATKIKDFNTNSSGDFGDWAASSTPDAFDAFATTGKVAQISEADLQALDVIGWNRGTAATAALTGATAAQSTTTMGLGHAQEAVAEQAGRVIGHFASGVSELDYYYG